MRAPEKWNRSLVVDSGHASLDRDPCMHRPRVFETAANRPPLPLIVHVLRFSAGGGGGGARARLGDLHAVGGLARGVRAEELAALVARALPPGAGSTAEVMRDASTGIERGFGFVTVAGGEEARAAAERAIAAYNGTK